MHLAFFFKSETIIFPVTHPTESVVNRALLLPLFSQEDDVIVEESSLSASEGEIDGDGSEDDIRELRARRHALAHKLAQQQKRRDKIQVSPDAIFICTPCLLLTSMIVAPEYF